jgi:hypothetical protein
MKRITTIDRALLETTLRSEGKLTNNTAYQE